MALALVLSGPARAEQNEVRIAIQYGIGYLPLHVVRHLKLLEQEAAKRGLPDLAVTWTNLGGGSAMNDGLLSGSLDLVSGGVGAFVTIWAKTRGSLDVRGVASLNALPIYLVTNNPNVVSLKDLTDQDKIALPAVGVSIQAVTLQMAAEQAFGPGHYQDLDQFTVTMKHPDALSALLSKGAGITGHFGGPPFQEQELAAPGTHRLLSSYDVLGGPATFNSVWTTAAFRDRNPRIYAAFLAALRQAIDLINRDPDEATRIYLAEDESRLEPAFVRRLITSPDARFTTTPLNILKYVSFMHKTGAIKVGAQSWKDLFFPEIQDEPGS
jgi:NitT/TauT family transport system substrate-binding protein